MFLPVLLVRDFGVWGWVVFAVPNVIGAAAMGWVLSSERQSRQLASAHRGACGWFSAVTIAFQIFFAGWMVRRLLGPAAVPVAFAATALILAIGRRGGDRRTAAVLWALSAAAFAAVVMSGQVTVGEVLGPPTPATPVEIACMAATSVFGFLLCPYLDLTFHQAFQGAVRNGRPAARWAFTLGFVVFFAPMIVFTLVYVPLLGPMLEAGGPGPGEALPWVIGGHMVLQLAFTAAVHWRAVVGEDDGSLARGVVGLVGGFVLAGLVPMALAAVPRFRGLDSGEAMYRGFMAFYGLVFPAYVWLCVLPARRTGRGPTAGMLAAFVAAVVLAGPAFWMAFIERRAVWMAPGVAIVLAARLFVRAGGSRDGDEGRTLFVE